MEGESRKNCVIDARVSSERQLLGHGIENQLDICLFYVKQRQWNPLLTYTKTYSGRKEEREDFKKILADIRDLQRQGTTVHHYIFASIDRLTRTGGEGFSAMKREIKKLGVEPVDARGIIQPEQNTLEHHGFTYEWSQYSPTDIAQLMEAERAKSEVRDMLTRMIGAEIKLVKQGYAIGPPLDGYLNVTRVVDGKEVKVWAADAERAVWFRTIFQLRALGSLSDPEIVARINAEGFHTKPTNIWSVTDDGRKIIVGRTKPKPLSVKRLQLIVQRIGYAGVKLEKWNAGTPVWVQFADGQGSLVDLDTFNAANRGTVHLSVLGSGLPQVQHNYTKWQVKRQVRQRFRPEYQFDKMIVCSVCEKPLFNSGMGNRGRSGKYYRAYHCGRSDACRKTTGRIPQAHFETTIRAVLKNLRTKHGFLEQLHNAIVSAFERRMSEIETHGTAVQSNIKTLKNQQEALLESFYATTSPTVRERTENRIEELEKQINEAKATSDTMRVGESEIEAFIEYVRYLLEHLEETLADNRFPLEQKALFGLVFEGLPSWCEMQIGTPKLGLIFRLSEQFKKPKSSSVRLDRFDWNQIEETILNWNRVFEQNMHVREIAESLNDGNQKKRIKKSNPDDV